MHNQEFFIQAFIFLAAAVISVPIAKRLGLGSVLGYLLAGIVIGPFVFGFIGDSEEGDIMHFAEFGVVMMLFLIGLELKPSLLWKMRKSIFGLGGLQVFITASLITTVALLFNLKINQAISIGLILALSSTAIVLQTLSEKGLLKNEGGQSSFSILLFQDIAVIPILAILPLLATTHAVADQPDHGVINAPTGWQQLLLIIGIVGAIIIAGRFASRYIFRAIASTGLREIFTAAALLLIIAIALAMTKAGLSPALGTFLAGVVLADNEYRHELESDIEPFKGLLLGLFFIAVGASINFKLLIENPMLILGLLLSLILLKGFILFVLARFFKLKGGSKWLLTFALAQGGEFAFVLVSFSLQNNIFTERIGGIIMLVVALSMATTPLLLIINDKLIQPFYMKKTNLRPSDTIEENENPVIIAGFGRFGLVIGRLLLANGFKATILDNDPSHIDNIRKYGFKVYYGDASRPDLLESAGIAHAKVLIIAIDDQEKSIQIAEYIERNYPNVKVYARAKDFAHAYELSKLKVADYKMEISYSSIELGISALTSLGFEKYQARRAANIFKHHNHDVKKKLFEIWEGDKKHYIDEVKRHAAELDEILLAEKEHAIHESDDAWDTTTLREEILIMNEERKNKN